MPDFPIIPCQRRSDWSAIIEEYAEALRERAYTIGDHGLSRTEFEETGLFRSAIERLGGRQAATTGEKFAFMQAVLDYMQRKKAIASWRSAGGGERHDLEVQFPDGWVCCIEAKGCLDGNNTNIFLGPRNADEFVLWSLCQNPGADPRHNAWSGIHTRLGSEIVASGKLVDGLIIRDMLCGTLARPCPKIIDKRKRSAKISNMSLPPPCMYLFPRTVPDARNNPEPPVHDLDDGRFLRALSEVFRTHVSEIIKVGIQVRMKHAEIQRCRTFTGGEEQVYRSSRVTIKRAR